LKATKDAVENLIFEVFLVIFLLYVWNWKIPIKCTERSFIGIISFLGGKYSSNFFTRHFNPCGRLTLHINLSLIRLKVTVPQVCKTT